MDAEANDLVRRTVKVGNSKGDEEDGFAGSSTSEARHDAEGKRRNSIPIAQLNDDDAMDNWEWSVLELDDLGLFLNTMQVRVCIGAYARVCERMHVCVCTFACAFAHLRVLICRVAVICA